MRSIPIPSSNPNTPTNTLAPTTTTIVTTKTTTTTTPSPWHSPIPYLFGGLAIIMALIALALLMLACSYWRLTRTQNNNNNNNNNNVLKEGDDDTQNKEHTKVYEEKILVIMAGDHNPTFLATPSCHNSSSLEFGNLDFHKHLGNSEDCDDDKSHKEIVHNHDDVVVVVTDATHENGSSQHEQHGQ